MKNSPWPIDEIDHRLRDNVGDLVAYFAGTPGKRHGNAMRWGNKHGLKADVSGPAKGRITPFDGAGKGMSPFQYIQSEMNLSFPSAVDWGANWLGISPDYKLDPEAIRRRTERRKRERLKAEAEEKSDRIKRTAKAVAILKATQEAAGTPVEAYLKARGISATLPPDIRFLPPQNGSYGAMVAVARDSDGIVQAVQRVFIHDGKKAPVDVQKRTNGVMDGAAVRLPASLGDELVLAEGPETGLSVWQAWGRETWIALGSIAKLVDDLPTDRRIIIARDADAPNSQADKALNKAVMAMIERGASVFIAMPPNPTKPGYDFNDALRDCGDSALADALASCQATHANELPNFLSLDEARAETQKVISHFFDEAVQSKQPPVWLINIGLGIGKTHTALVEVGKFIKATDKRKRKVS